MPVRGIRSKSARGLSFSWYSFRTGYCLLYMLTTILDTLLTINMIIHVKLDVRNIGEATSLMADSVVMYVCVRVYVRGTACRHLIANNNL